MYRTASLPGRSVLLKTVHCTFPDGAAFLEGVRMSEGLASFRYTPERGLPPELDVGTLVIVVIELADSERTFRVHARVIKRKPEGDTREIRFELLRDETPRQELLLLAAEGESIPYRRRAHDRYACAIAATLRFENQNCKGEIRDVSKGGFRFHTDNGLFQVGSSLKAELDLETGPAVIPAVVVGQITGGPDRGLSCEWSLRSSEQKQTIETLIRAIRD